MMLKILQAINYVILQSDDSEGRFYDAIKGILESVVEAFLGLASVFAALIDKLSLRNPYPCVETETRELSTGSGGETTSHNFVSADNFAMKCGEDGMAQPSLFPISWDGGANIAFTGSADNFLSEFLTAEGGGFWNSMAEMHVVIVALSFVFLLLGAATTYSFWAVGWGGEKLSIYRLIKTSILIILWWPVASLIMWAFEGINMLLINLGGVGDFASSGQLDFISDSLSTTVEYNGQVYSVPNNLNINMGVHTAPVFTDGYKLEVGGEDVTNELLGYDNIDQESNIHRKLRIELSNQFADPLPGTGAGWSGYTGDWTVDWDRDFTGKDWEISYFSKEEFIQVARNVEPLEVGETEASSQVYRTLEQIRYALANDLTDGTVLGSLIFIVLMLLLLLPYLILGMILTLLWFLRVMMLVILFLTMPLALAIQTWKFKGMASLSETAEKAFPLFMFLLVISIPVALVGGMANIMLFLANSLSGGLAGAPESVQLTIFLMFLMWLPIIYGASPFILAKYTSYSPSKEFNELGGKWTKLDNYDPGEMMKGDSDESITSSLKSGDIAGAITATSGKAQGGILDRLGKGEEYDTLGEASRGETVGKMKEGAEKAASEASTRGELMGQALGEEGSTLGNYREKQNERAKMLEEKKKRENQDELLDERDEKYMNWLNREYKDADWRHLGETFSEEDVVKNRGRIANEAFGLNAFDGVEGYDDMMNTMNNQLANAAGQGGLNKNDYVETLAGVNNVKDLGRTLRENGISEEMVEKDFDEDDLTSDNPEEALVEMLQKDGRLDTVMKGMFDSGQVELSAEIHEDARETYNMSQHAEEYEGLDINDLTPEESIGSDLLEKFNGDYDAAKHYKKGREKIQDLKVEKASKTLEKLGEVRGKMTGGLFDAMQNSVENYAKNRLQEKGYDPKEHDEDEQWRLLLEEEDIDIDQILEDSGFEMSDEYVQNFVEEFEKQWDNLGLAEDKDRENFVSILESAQEEVKDELDEISISEIEDYAEYVDIEELGYDDVDNVEDLVQNYNKAVAEEQLEMLGMAETMSLDAAKELAEQGNFDEAQVMENVIEKFDYESDEKKEKLVEFGKKVQELENNNMSIDDITE